MTKGKGPNKGNKYGVPILYKCISDNYTDKALLLIKAGANVNAKDRYGDTPLSQAISKKNFTIVNVLIKAGADVNAKDRHGDTPLSEAIYKKDLTVVKALIEAGADVNAKDHMYGNVLFMAVSYVPEAVEDIIKAGSNINSIVKGEHIFSEFCFEKEIKTDFLISLLPSIENISLHVNSFLQAACVRQDKLLIKACLEYGADPKLLKPEFYKTLSAELKQFLSSNVKVDAEKLNDVVQFIISHILQEMPEASIQRLTGEPLKVLKVLLKDILSSEKVIQSLCEDTSAMVLARKDLAKTLAQGLVTLLAKSLYYNPTTKEFNQEEIIPALRNISVTWKASYDEISKNTKLTSNHDELIESTHSTSVEKEELVKNTQPIVYQSPISQPKHHAKHKDEYKVAKKVFKGAAVAVNNMLDNYQQTMEATNNYINQVTNMNDPSQLGQFTGDYVNHVQSNFHNSFMPNTNFDMNTFNNNMNSYGGFNGFNPL